MSTIFYPLNKDGSVGKARLCTPLGKFCVARRSDGRWGIFAMTGHCVGGRFFYKAMARKCLAAIIESPILMEAARRLEQNQPMDDIDPTPLMDEIFAWQVRDEMLLMGEDYVE